MTRTGRTRNAHMMRNSPHTASHAEPEHPLSVLDVIFKASWLLELPSQADLYRPRGGDARRFRDQLRDPESSVFFNAGMLVVIYARAHAPFAAADCWLAAQNLILAACALGLGTCIVASASNALDSAEAKVEFGLPAEAVAVAPIVVRVPDRNAIEPAGRRMPHIVYWK